MYFKYICKGIKLAYINTIMMVPTEKLKLN